MDDYLAGLSTEGINEDTRNIDLCSTEEMVAMINRQDALVAVAVAAAFMALIIRIIKNVFEQAIGMKSELDLTV